jgi:hypothetical protein
MYIRRGSVLFGLLLGAFVLGIVTLATYLGVSRYRYTEQMQNVLSASTFYYVSPSGDDANPGNQAQPWKTLNKAASVAMSGDTVLIMPGTYNEKLVPVTSGSSGKYITFKAAKGSVILDGTGMSLSSGGFGDGIVNIAGKSYIKIQGLTVKNSSQTGVNIQPDSSGTKSSYIEISGMTILNSTQVGIKATNSQNITIDGNTINYVKYSSGIGIWGCNSVVVDHNTIVNAHVESESNGGHEESLSIASTTNFEVKNNDISMSGHDGYLGNEGIDVKEASQHGKVHNNYIHDYAEDGGGLYVDAWKAVSPSLNNIDVYANYLKNTATGINIGSEQGGTAENINVYNNIVYNTGSVGIGVPGRTGDGLRKNINIYNNTIYKAQYNGGAGIYITSSNIKNIVIRNNIVYFNNTNGEITAASAKLLQNISADHNLVYGSKSCSDAYPNCVELSNNPSGYSGIFGNITADPKFVSTKSADFHLQLSSPARGKGVNLKSLVATDYEGAARSSSTSFDIGAFVAPPIPTPAPTPKPTPTPTPTPATTNIMKNASFESGSSPWYSPWWLDVSHGTVATLSKDTSTSADGSVSARINVTKGASSIWYTQFFQDSLPITAGKNYKLSFWAKAQENKSVQLAIQKVESPYTEYSIQTIKVSPTWQKYNLVFTPKVSDSNVKLTFFLSGDTGSTWFDGFTFGY